MKTKTKKRTSFMSVTTTPCRCGHMAQLAKAEHGPIHFNDELNEYSIQYTTTGGQHIALAVYHCILCGGAMPASRRSHIFSNIPIEEKRRLEKLARQLASLEDVYTVLGKPDFDDQVPVMPGSIGEANSRTLTYQKASPVADVHVNVSDAGQIRVTFVPKPKKHRPARKAKRSSPSRKRLRR